MNTRMHIKPGIFYASCDAEGIVMDLVNNRYLAVGSVGARLLGMIERGCSADEAALDLCRDSELDGMEARDLVHGLLAAWRRDELLLSEGARPPCPAPRSRPRGKPADRQIDLHRFQRTPVSARAIGRFLAACAWYRVHLARHGLLEVLNRFVRMKPRAPAANEDGLYATARAACFVRDIFQQGKPDCLHRSIELAVALRWAGYDAEVCFGIRRVPFFAHAWVELEGRTVFQRVANIQYNVIIARF